MPGRNVYKTYVKGGFYHVYNRGVEKRKIFLDTQDYKVFLKNLKTYLSEPEDPSKLKFTLQGTTFKGIPRQSKNYYQEVDLVCYCLMPNHFHFLVKQSDKSSLQIFMKSLTVKYSMYFNKKYDRVGQLFQGRYKAALINDDKYLLHLSRYIHLNPSEDTDNLVGAYSSYANYLGLKKTKWLKSDTILNFFNKEVALEFKKINNYKDFVENYKKDSREILEDLTLED